MSLYSSLWLGWKRRVINLVYTLCACSFAFSFQSCFVSSHNIVAVGMCASTHPRGACVETASSTILNVNWRCRLPCIGAGIVQCATHLLSQALHRPAMNGPFDFLRGCAELSAQEREAQRPCHSAQRETAPRKRGTCVQPAVAWRGRK